ncbi:MAG: tetratricopeptide repeat protein [Bacteroidetes bacterium]|nr:tetratricopeptide repeat protein [Bacteroidota bacterium]
MKLKSVLTVISVLMIGFVMMGIDGCGSKEMTSARMYYQQKQNDKALASVNNELAKNPGNAEAWFLKGTILFDMKQPLEMTEAYRQALKLGLTPAQKQDAENRIKNAWVVAVNEGIALMNKGADNPDNYLRAVESFKKASTILPDSAQTYYNAAISLYNAQMYREAISTMEEFHARRQPDQESVQLILLAYNNLKDYDGALAFLNKHKNTKTLSQDWIYESIAQTYITADRGKEALQAFLEASEASPNNEALKYNIGVLYLGNEDFQNAIKYFEKAIELKTDYKEAKYNLGVTYLKLAKATQQALETAYTKEKDRKKKEALGNDKSYLEYYKKALPHLEAVQDTKKDDVTFWTVMGQVYTALGMNEKAKEAFDRFK